MARPGLLCFILVLFLTGLLEAKALPVKHSIRLDPGRLYELYDFSRHDMSVVAETVAQDIASSGFSRVFVFAYSPLYGAFFQTKYPQTEVENFLGQGNFLKLFVSAAQNRKLDIVFSIPINNYETPWTLNPHWRVKNSSGKDYKPDAQSHYLSASSLEYRQWFLGLTESILKDFPGIQGLEALEPHVDLYWTQQSDFHEDALKAFKSQFPKSQPGSPDWWQFRSQELTGLLGLFFQRINQNQKESHVVQTWPAQQSGNLISAQNLRDLIGLDFVALQSLPSEKRPQFIQIQLLWQQWKAQFGTPNFNPEWVKTATLQLQDFFKSPPETSTNLILHIEKSEFKGPRGTIKPSKQEFLSNLRHSVEINLPVDVYDYTQLKQSGLLKDVRRLLK